MSATIHDCVFVGDDALVAEAMDELNAFLEPGKHRNGASLAAIKKIESDQESQYYKKSWKWWESFGCRYFPNLAKIALRVLTKQVGIGAVERASYF
ncbi:hAT family dimerization domain-containing protein [bacterium]|nr:hAT family dimerization domain-containing protein [bacterium]